MEQKCKRCGKIVEGEGYKDLVHEYQGGKGVSKKVNVYCSESCFWEDFLHKDNEC